MPSAVCNILKLFGYFQGNLSALNDAGTSDKDKGFSSYLYVRRCLFLFALLLFPAYV